MAVLTSKPGRRRRRAAALVLTVLATAWSGRAAAQTTSLEYAVKANYLYKFAPFVEWPARVFETASSPFVVCVAGQDPFGETLDSAVRGQTVGGRPVIVRRLAQVTEAPACQVLYLGRSKTQKPAEIVALLHGAAVLTVTDQDQGSSDGMIQFVLRDGRVRFVLDVGRAQASGLTLSSKLQQLAISLKGAR